VPVAESIRGFKEILEGKHDDLPERAFFMKGSIDQVVEEAGGSKQKKNDSGSGESQSDSGSDSDSESDSDSGGSSDTEAG
jgi:hypothetical protein